MGHGATVQEETIEETVLGGEVARGRRRGGDRFGGRDGHCQLVPRTQKRRLHPLELRLPLRKHIHRVLPRDLEG